MTLHQQLIRLLLTPKLLQVNSKQLQLQLLPLHSTTNTTTTLLPEDVPVRLTFEALRH